MSAVWQNLLKIPAGILEIGLTAMDGGGRTVQTALEALSGQGSDWARKTPPVNGPQNLDGALSDLANQLVRLGRITPLEGAEIGGLIRETLRSARRSFRYVDVTDPRTLALSFAAPISAAGMIAEIMLRAVVYYWLQGPRRFRSSAANIVEMFSEVGPFLGLQYQAMIDRHLERLKRQPQDSAARLELGRLYAKCARFDDAVRELAIVAGQHTAQRGAALHESAVAHSRAGRFEQAIQDGIGAMAANPGNERARFWLWWSARRRGGYPESVPPEYRMEMKAGYEPASVQFEDIAARIGMDKTSGGRGTAVFDYNNDGLLDVLIMGQSGSSLYRNNGDGTFSDVSVQSGLDKCVTTFAVTAGDYDNDGFVDLFVTRVGFYPGSGGLYHNNGDGTFTDVTEKAGVQAWGPSWTASWVDYDLDGYLDLFIANNLGGVFDRQAPNRLFHNNGDGCFTEVAGSAGLGTVFPTMGSAWGDYDNDGYPDLFISGIGRPQLFHNNGNGTFTDVGMEAGFTEFVAGSVCCWCDYDNDGWLDIAQFVWSDHEDVIYTMKTGHGPGDGLTMRIYHNNRDGTFSDRTGELGIDGCWGTMSGNFGDVNNDGFIDFMLGNGGPRMDRYEPLVLLESDGERYHNATFSSGLGFGGKNHGVNCADLFGDGRLSIIVAAGGQYPGDLLTANVFCPVSLPGNYLNVRLAGVKSNRDGIGARIRLTSGDLRQMREVGGGTNFGCLPFEQHFGLGKRETLDALEIRWPSGLLQQVRNPPVNQTICITEGRPAWEGVYRR
jgi:ASPIC and UnbV/FG-GAP-like repeat